MLDSPAVWLTALAAYVELETCGSGNFESQGLAAQVEMGLYAVPPVWERVSRNWYSERLPLYSVAGSDRCLYF
jgi:hypothetical protein